MENDVWISQNPWRVQLQLDRAFEGHITFAAQRELGSPPAGMNHLELLAGWIVAASAWAFLLFGVDKWKANRNGRRVSEATLCWISALGGWPGGFFGMIVFRHKSAKGSFQLKLAATFFVWAGLVYAAWRWVM